jgi:hypothetical protein
MERENFAAQLEKFAIKYAKSKGFRFGDGVERYHLPPVLMKAADDINHSPREHTVAKAEKAIAGYIDEMIGARGRLAGYEKMHPDSIGEETWFEAKNSLKRRGLCPGFWPFC